MARLRAALVEHELGRLLPLPGPEAPAEVEAQPAQRRAGIYHWTGDVTDFHLVADNQTKATATEGKIPQRFSGANFELPSRRRVTVTSLAFVCFAILFIASLKMR